MRSSAVRAAAFPAALVLAIGLSACGKSAFKTQTLTLTEMDTNFHGFVAHNGPPDTKIGPRGPEQLVPGDELSIAHDLVDSSKKKVGENNGVCVTTRPGQHLAATEQCTATASLTGGSLALTVSGEFSAPVLTGAIIGGTGKYAGAGGTVTISRQGNNPSIDTFHIQIPQK